MVNRSAPWPVRPAAPTGWPPPTERPACRPRAAACVTSARCRHRRCPECRPRKPSEHGGLSGLSRQDLRLAAAGALVKDASGVHWGQDTSHGRRAQYHQDAPDRRLPAVPRTRAIRGLQARYAVHPRQRRARDGGRDLHSVPRGPEPPDRQGTERVGHDRQRSARRRGHLPKCHGEAPHEGANADRLNAHVSKLACQTCHIPEVTGIFYENWGRRSRTTFMGR